MLLVDKAAIKPTFEINSNGIEKHSGVKEKARQARQGVPVTTIHVLIPI